MYVHYVVLIQCKAFWWKRAMASFTSGHTASEHLRKQLSTLRHNIIPGFCMDSLASLHWVLGLVVNNLHGFTATLL